MKFFSVIIIWFIDPPDESKGVKRRMKWPYVFLWILLGCAWVSVFFLHPDLSSIGPHGSNVKLNVPLFEPYKAAVVVETSLAN